MKKTAKAYILAVFCCLFCPPFIYGGDPQFPTQLPVPQLSTEAASQALSRFKSQHLAGDFALKIALKPIGRIPGTPYEGLFMGTQGPTGAMAQLVITPAAASNKAAPSAPALTYRLLIKQGAEPALWVKLNEEPTQALIPSSWLTPLVSGLPYTPFDLLMPFTHWQGTYIKSERTNGRIVHRFRMMPSAPLLEACPALGPVMLGIDGGFYTLIRAELLDTNGRPKRTLKVGSFKKVKDQWMIKTMELTDHTTRAKAELSLQAAALSLTFPTSFWLPSSLESPLPVIPRSAFSAL